MDSISRRRFLNGTLAAGAGLVAGRAFGKSPLAVVAPSTKGRVVIDPDRTISTLDRNLFGSFIEHLGRSVYEGVYEPGSKFADSNGFRTDVMDAIKKLGVPIIRYPGGNFVSGYNWLDGVGPKKERPPVYEMAWDSTETNQFGTNEFITWCRQVGTEPLLATNLGTGTPAMAAALVEYCNVDKGTRWSDLRRKHGYEQPHNIKYWCLGNEMDGPWQIGHMPAREYGIKARDAARQMRYIDRDLKLIVCGSSGPFMPTFLSWDQQTLEECYDLVDAISLHRYFGNADETGGDTKAYLAMNLSMDRQIEEIIAVCDIVRGLKRSKKTLWLSFDEWNVWYRARGGKFANGERKVAAHLLEEVYNLEDALLVGGLLNTLIRRSNRVRVACLAQLVNVIAPIMTNENGLYLQTIYYPYFWAIQHATGNALELEVEAETYPIERFGDVPFLDVSGTLDSEKKTASLFVLNRDLEKARTFDVEWHESTPSRVTAFETLTGDDLKAANGFDAPKRVAPQTLQAPKTGSRMTLEVPARSYSLIRFDMS
jgi:alpha-L-arabinofuranosidase